jgi:hypothetical protein
MVLKIGWLIIFFVRLIMFLKRERKLVAFLIKEKN